VKSKTSQVDTKTHRTYLSHRELCVRRGAPIKLSSPEFFAEVGPRPAGLVLVYRNTSRGLVKGNIFWGTRRDLSNHLRITLDGRTLTIREWAKETGLSKWTLISRLKAKWSVRQALETPLKNVVGCKHGVLPASRCTPCQQIKNREYQRQLKRDSKRHELHRAKRAAYWRQLKARQEADYLNSLDPEMKETFYALRSAFTKGR
jgi:hypothetical protein